MGLSLTGPRQRLLRGAYVAAFVLVLLYAEVPWAGAALDWLSAD